GGVPDSPRLAPERPKEFAGGQVLVEARESELRHARNDARDAHRAGATDPGEDRILGLGVGELQERLSDVAGGEAEFGGDAQELVLGEVLLCLGVRGGELRRTPDDRLELAPRETALTVPRGRMSRVHND